MSAVDVIEAKVDRNAFVRILQGNGGALGHVLVELRNKSNR